MKTLFNKFNTYGEQANIISNEVEKLVQDIVNKNPDYFLSDIESVILHSVIGKMAEIKLVNMMKEFKESK